jgi:hypothetical protein
MLVEEEFVFVGGFGIFLVVVLEDGDTGGLGVGDTVVLEDG